MLIGAVLMLLGHAGAWLLAIALQKRLNVGGAAVNVTGAFVLHALIVTLVVLLAGSAGVLGPWSLAAGGILCGLAGLALGVRLHSIRELALTTWRESPAVAGISAALLALIFIRHLLNTLYFCPFTEDELEYHLPKLATWMQKGTLARPDLLDTRGYFPAGMQLLQAWWVGFVRHDALIEGAALETLALAGAAVVALARRLGATRPSALLAAALFAAAPAILLHSTTALNDLPAAAFVLAGFALTGSRTALVLASAALLLGGGIKPTVLFAAPGVFLLAIPAWRQTTLDLPRAGAIVLIALAGFAGSYWYLRNAIEFGNPFYPVSASFTGATERPTIGQALHSGGPNPANLAGNVRAIFGPRLTALGGVTNPNLPDQTGWGWPLTLLGLPALAFMAWRDDRWRLPAGAFVLSLVCVLLLVQCDVWTARFVFFFPALLACAIAVLPGPVVVATLAGLGSYANLWEARVPLPFTPPGAASLMQALPIADRDSWVIAFGGASAEHQSFLASTAPVLAMTFNYRVYALARGDYRRRVEHVGLVDADELMRVFEASGCRWLIVANPPAPSAAAVDACVANRRLRRVAPGLYVRP
jgi:hypothetical protein